MITRFTHFHSFFVPLYYHPLQCVPLTLPLSYSASPQSAGCCLLGVCLFPLAALGVMTSSDSSCTCLACSGHGVPVEISDDTVEFVWRGIGMPSSNVVTLKNSTCAYVWVNVLRANNGARVAVRPKSFVMRPRSAAEILFVQAGASRSNSAKSRFKVDVALMNGQILTTWSVKLSANLVEPSPLEHFNLPPSSDSEQQQSF